MDWKQITASAINSLSGQADKVVAVLVLGAIALMAAYYLGANGGAKEVLIAIASALGGALTFKAGS